ncbi:MAG: GIY-YIG nuclease family protein, partial [Microbacterium sp.]|uniref:GIY-YIG nuclease family protein n=1 Tax=Microbacterium sp. TaxID=51671 RepID=UPI001ACA0573
MDSRCALCGGPPHPGAPLALCLTHLLEAHDWVAGEFGMTDLLPSPCVFCGSRLGVLYPSGWQCAVCEWRVGEVPPDDPAASRVDVVYYLRFRDRIKIGTTANPAQRFAALPHDEVLAFERGDRTLEQRRHAEFAHLRIPGTEWFETDQSLLAHVAALRAPSPDPWSLL